MQLSTVVFSGNTADHGAAIYFNGQPGPGSFLTNITVNSHASGSFINFIRAPAYPAPWRCPLGKYMPNSDVSQPFFGCARDCSAGRFGDAPDHTDGQCSGPCPTGHYCLAGTAVPIACEPGTHNENNGSETRSSCQECAAGTIEPLVGSSVCTVCLPGSFQPVPGATRCLDCQPGGYCVDARKCGGGWNACVSAL